MNRNTIHDLWKYVKIGGEDECWPWTGGTHQKTGYGKARVYDRSTRLAHILIFEAATGKQPKKPVQHSCNNKPCCNPKHLHEGTYSHNLNYYHATVGAEAKSNTGIKGVTYSNATRQYRARTSQHCLYVGPSVFAAWAARLEWELNQVYY